MKYQALKALAIKRNLKITPKTPSGCTGYYFRLTPTIGVKVYGDFGSYSKPSRVRWSFGYWRVARILNAMRRAYPLGVSPKPYFIAPVKMEGQFYIGLFMEHISGKKGYPQPKADAAHKKLKTIGLSICDRGAHNMIVKKDGSVKIIDFDGFRWGGKDER